MSSSTQNKCFQVLFTLIVFTLFSTIRTVSSKKFVELRLQMGAVSSTIHATLTDTYDDKRYNLHELISNSGSTIKGKIEVSGEEDHFNIHYAFKHIGVDSKERLVDHDKKCLIFNHEKLWHDTLPGIKKPLLNSLLLMGPSILYRLSHASLIWKSVDDRNIRGVLMKGAQTKINEKLTITYYYKNYFDDQIGLRNPSRIEFNGIDSESKHSSETIENLILDIHVKNNEFVDKLKYKVQPSHGIQCPHYLSGDKSFPKLKSEYVHFTMHEYNPDSPMVTELNEISASESTETLRIKKVLPGTVSEAIYDYKTGIEVILKPMGGCIISPLDQSAPGLSINRYLNLEKLFLFGSNKRYLGKTYLKQRPGLIVDAWESIIFDININGKKVDKAVIVHYFVESPYDTTFDNYTLISNLISTYKHTGPVRFSNYSLLESFVRDYSNFQKAGSEAEFHDMFTMKNCKNLISDKILTLNFKIICDEEESQFYQKRDCLKFTESHAYKLKQKLLDRILLSRKISRLRIVDMHQRFTENQVETEVTFLDKPVLKYIFYAKTMSVSSETFKNVKDSMTLEATTARNEYECLTKISQSQSQRSISIVIFRSIDSFCGALERSEDLKEDFKSGSRCKVFHIPLSQLVRVAEELPLEQIHDSLLREFSQSFAMHYEGGYRIYRVTDIIDVTRNKDTISDYRYTKVGFALKFKMDDLHAKTVTKAKTLNDCYRACHDSELLSCNTFSLCSTEKSIDCRVSDLSMSHFDEENHVERDANCSIMALNILDNYSEARNKKFKMQLTTHMQARLETCAELCHASPDCLSFEYCGVSCSFGGFYTDSVTEYDESCRVFYPKLSTKYQKTGNKLVAEVFYTEMNSNLDNCAALCDGWSDGHTKCKSFNYCPKSTKESICALTEFSIKDSDVKMIDGDYCSNYELKVGSNGKKNSVTTSTGLTKGTSGSGAFGIIVLFLLVGSLLGFLTPFIYSRFVQIRISTVNNESFSWTRKTDTSMQDELIMNR